MPDFPESLTAQESLFPPEEPLPFSVGPGAEGLTGSPFPPKVLAKHFLLFMLTLISTYLVGGFWYAFTIMLILFAHEMGHFFMSRKYGVPATLPFFIPFPFSPFGTLGAVIKMRGRIWDRRALFDIGAAGPLLGLVFTIPAILIGLRLSRVVLLSRVEQQLIGLGDSLLFAFLQWLVLGNIPRGYDVVLHPVAYAGWVGLFVTALNLLPIGQLDGGHIVYALFGARAQVISRVALAGLAFICLFYNPGWLLLVILLLLFGVRHPPTLDEITPLDPRRRLIGILTLGVFFVSFTPIPFTRF